MMNGKGKFIVIDGTDGSGKTTQTALLVEKLKSAGYLVEVADFPQYGQKSAGLVEEYLNGKFGTADEVGPYRGSIFYACDRYDASFKIKKWLNEGKVIISNRYVTANMGHQGGKIKDGLERKTYFDWLYNLEYEIFAIPRPDLNIILHVDAAVAQKLVDNKGARDYVGGTKRDIHENDLEHLRNAEKVYLEIAKTFPNFALIECTRDNQIMPKDEIHSLLWNKVIELIRPPEKELDPLPIFMGTKGRENDGLKPENLWEQAVNESKKTTDNSSIDFAKSNFKIIREIEKEKIISKNPDDLISDNLTVERLSPNAKLPIRPHEHDAGLDLFSLDYYSLAPGERTNIRTGIKIAIPTGYVGLIWDKGGLAKEGLHTMAGVIDAGYRGEVLINIINLGQTIAQIAHGQKIAQLLIQKVELPKIIESKIEDETTRGEGRFGSTGLF